MNTNNKSRNLDLLDHIQQVDAPEFLFTRIRSKIESSENTRISAPWILAGSFCLVALVVLNIAIVFGSGNANTKNNDLGQSMNLMTDNSIYK